MTYYMRFLGIDNLGRIKWRGTGFNPVPGGITMVPPNDLRVVIAYLKQRDRLYELETPPVFH